MKITHLITVIAFGLATSGCGGEIVTEAEVVERDKEVEEVKTYSSWRDLDLRFVSASVADCFNLGFNWEQGKDQCKASDNFYPFRQLIKFTNPTENDTKPFTCSFELLFLSSAGGGLVRSRETTLIEVPSQASRVVPFKVPADYALYRVDFGRSSISCSE
jgi:hypothetical protein